MGTNTPRSPVSSPTKRAQPANTLRSDDILTNTDALRVARACFHACERGEGWEICQQFCSSDATFIVQATDALPGPAISACQSAEQYTEWMKGVVANMGDIASYEIDAVAFDAETSTAIFAATFGGFSHYVYTMRVEGGKVVAVTKVWNDAYAFKVMSGELQGQPTSSTPSSSGCAGQEACSMEAATACFHACERGEGWEICRQFCSTDATFIVQATDALPGPAISACQSAEQYTEWMKGVVANMGDIASYEIDAVAFDAETSTAIFAAT